MDDALRRALDFSNCETGSIMLLADGGNRLRIAAQVGLASEHIDRAYPANTGVAGIAMKARQPIFLRGSELSVDPRSASAADRRGVPTSVCIPLVTPKQNVLGTLNLNARRDSSDLLDVDAAVLDAMARLLAVLIENMLLREDLEGHVEELVSLYRASELTLTGHDQEDALGTVLRIVAQSLGAAGASLFELQTDGSLRFGASYRTEPRPTKRAANRPQAQPLLIQRAISDAATIPYGRWPGESGRRLRGSYGWVAGLRSGNRVIGLLEIELGQAGSVPGRAPAGPEAGVANEVGPLPPAGDPSDPVPAVGPARTAPAMISSRRLAGLVDQVALALAHTRALATAQTRERQLATLLDRLIAVEEEERLRLAHEIHDGLAQTIAGAHQALQSIRDKLPLSGEPLVQEFDRGLAILREALAEIRRLIAGLRPLVLEDFGLATAIREQLQLLQEQQGWEAELSTRLRATRLPVPVEVGLYRIAQEALNNAAKHAHTRKVSVRLEERNNGILLEVRDFGRGFIDEEARNGSEAGHRVGLPGMEERAQLLGGACRITSSPGHGTRVRVELPRKSYT
jgi:signal transduction histidine kinase